MIGSIDGNKKQKDEPDVGDEPASLSTQRGQRRRGSGTPLRNLKCRARRERKRDQHEVARCDVGQKRERDPSKKNPERKQRGSVLHPPPKVARLRQGRDRKPSPEEHHPEEP